MGIVARATLIVLAEAAEIGLPEATAVPAAAFDPFLRAVIRRRASEAVTRAEARTSIRAGDHVLRVAFLSVHPAAGEVDANDERAVCEAFDRLSLPLVPHLEKANQRRATAYREAAADRAPAEPVAEPTRKRARQFWPVTTPLVGAIVLAVVGAGVAFAIPYWIPNDAESFRRTPFGRALGEPLTEVVANARATGGGSAGERALLADDVTRQIGPPAHVELERLLTVLPVAATATGTVDEAMAPVFSAMNALDGRLHEAHVPAFLHGYAYGSPGAYSVWIASYFVERRSEIVFDGSTTKTVWGRRLDSLNLLDSGVYKARAEDAVIVSLGVTERSFVETFLPALAKEAGPSDPGATPGMALEHEAGRVVARELRAETHVTAADAEELASAISRRNLALERLSRETHPDIELGPGAKTGLGGKLGEEALRLDAQMHMHRRKVAPAIDKITEIVEESFVARLHDEERFATMVFPKLAGSDFSATTRARVSSDLGSIARASCPHAALWLVVRKVSSASAERATAETVLRLLANELGAPVAPGRLSEDTLSRAVRPAFDVDAAKLRAAAAKAYEAAFTTPVPPLGRRVL